MMKVIDVMSICGLVAFLWCKHRVRAVVHFTDFRNEGNCRGVIAVSIAKGNIVGMQKGKFGIVGSPKRDERYRWNLYLLLGENSLLRVG